MRSWACWTRRLCWHCWGWTGWTAPPLRLKHLSAFSSMPCMWCVISLDDGKSP
ncbi:hypothetical protein PF005_g13605 [Phytophthora fragariae]|uniref:Uncharacterized protein n=1 Tax=Phytophthora fragariae TaxID=53985 RepID=A0A6A3RVN9_9STRA|nr:hypothetical protein PF003_g3739 [Phytophthora fragariae]KAE8938001.1 hypothetical protein PF009_g12101 [Phytophthora fragariae]KAE9101892.1 hypothetical protein PF010_g14301 [Phytophthora fragariae]KAE9103696.1 hypothetical protein PF007_g14308 [Phytophthora fragariae]KAE9204949.1 hypothetical protein PF005_g13605 [Phytophthora fragariae]